MVNFDVAHVNEQGQNIIIVLVSHQLTPSQENALQLCANSTGLGRRRRSCLAARNGNVRIFYASAMASIF